MPESKNGWEGPPKADSKSFEAEGYNQTYVILKTGNRQAKSSDYQDNDVFFRCGNWCYVGTIQFNGLELRTSDLPALIPALQKQQSSLRYYCNSDAVPTSSGFADPLSFYHEAADFFASEMTSEAVERELKKGSAIFPWIDSDFAQTYFELGLSEVPKCMDNVALIASKTYTRGLIIISIYCNNAMYFVVQSGEGDQPLLDVRFPDVSKHNQGIALSSYNNPFAPWRKITLWHILPCDAPKPMQMPKIRTLSVSSSNYQQTYCVMKSSWDNKSTLAASVHHDVLFRFGSWCYAGRVQLTPTLTLSDIPFVIPALRMQQSRLDYYCDVAAVPTNSPFANCLSYMQRLEPLIERELYESESVLNDLIDRLNKMGLAGTVTNWLEGDAQNSFFEFKLCPWGQGEGQGQGTREEDPMRGIELVATKSYHSSGVITVTIVFQNSIYVSVLEGDKENPLLDSRFPDVSGKGRGYQIQSYDSGQRDWPELRKVSVWQTVSALEQEFRSKTCVGDDKSAVDDAYSEDDDSIGDGGGGGGGGGGRSSIPGDEDASDRGRPSLHKHALQSDYKGTPTTPAPYTPNAAAQGTPQTGSKEGPGSRVSSAATAGTTHTSYSSPGMGGVGVGGAGGTAASDRSPGPHGDFGGRCSPLNSSRVSLDDDLSGNTHGGTHGGSGNFRNDGRAFPYRQVIVPEIAEEKSPLGGDRGERGALGPSTVTRAGAKDSGPWAESGQGLGPGLGQGLGTGSKECDEKGTLSSPIDSLRADRHAGHPGVGVGAGLGPGVGPGVGGGASGGLIGRQITSLSDDDGMAISRQVSALSDGSEHGSPTHGAPVRMDSLLARPHHIPQMSDSLAARMNEIRKTMGGGVMDAPWDAKGRPLGSLGGSGSGGGFGSPSGFGGKRVLGSPAHDAGDKK